jgi:serine O-acetyltransferase
MISKLYYNLYKIFIHILLKYSIDNQNKYVIENIKSDLYRATKKNDLKNLPLEMLKDPSLQFLFFYRLASRQPKSLIRKKIHTLSFKYHKKYFFKYGYQIPIHTKIGKGFQMLHFGNIVINPNAIIGQNVTIAQGVLIGQSNKGFPTIGNSVWIGANAIIVGNIKIGNNVLIVPGSYVNIDVPSNSLVMGNPCTITQKNESIISGYIVNTID